MRLIDADEIKNIKFAISKKISVYVRGWNDAIDSIIENAPTVEPEPIRHGNWEDNGEVIICSECGHFSYYMDCEDEYTDEDGFEHWNLGYPFYCKNCGAKMDGKENKG